jgi:hypothetical protein
LQSLAETRGRLLRAHACGWDVRHRDPEGWRLVRALAYDALVVGEGERLTTAGADATMALYERFWRAVLAMGERCPRFAAMLVRRGWPPTPASAMASGPEFECTPSAPLDVHGRRVYARCLEWISAPSPTDMVTRGIAYAEVLYHNVRWPGAADDWPDAGGGPETAVPHFIMTDGVVQAGIAPQAWFVGKRRATMIHRIGALDMMQSRDSALRAIDAVEALVVDECGLQTEHAGSPGDAADVAARLIIDAVAMTAKVDPATRTGLFCAMGLVRYPTRLDLPACVASRLSRWGSRLAADPDLEGPFYGAFFGHGGFMRLLARGRRIAAALRRLTAGRRTLQDAAASAVVANKPVASLLGSDVADVLPTDMYHLVLWYALPSMVDRIDLLERVAAVLGLAVEGRDPAVAVAEALVDCLPPAGS